MDRRTFLASGAAALLPSGAGAQQAAPAGAGNWPRDRPIRLIITYPPGGTSDFVARLFAQHLGEQLGQSVVVENRAGGGGVVGWTAAARAAPDGYTLLQTDNSLATAPPLHPDLTFDVLRDFTPISMMVDYASVFVVPAELPVRSWQEFVALVRQRGQAGSFYGSMGPGSSPHLYVEVLQELADLRMTHVSYRGMGPAMTDLLANRVQLLAAAPPTALGHIAAGRVRAIAVGTPGRPHSGLAGRADASGTRRRFHLQLLVRPAGSARARSGDRRPAGRGGAANPCEARGSGAVHRTGRSAGRGRRGGASPRHGRRARALDRRDPKQADRSGVVAEDRPGHRRCGVADLPSDRCLTKTGVWIEIPQWRIRPPAA